MSESSPNTMDIDQIMKMLPHRYPFLLVDRITDYVLFCHRSRRVSLSPCDLNVFQASNFNY